MAVLRELELRLELRPGQAPDALSLMLCNAADVDVTTTLAHLDDEGAVWRILHVLGAPKAVAAAEKALASYAPPWLIEKNVLGRSPRRLIAWVKYRATGTPSQTALAFKLLGRDTVISDRAHGRALTIRILTPDRGAVTAFLAEAERLAAPRYAFRLRYSGPVRAAEPEALTPAEEEALRVAQEAGHYAVPRKADVRQVAALLKVPPTTAAYRLRRAEAKLVAAHTGPAE